MVKQNSWKPVSEELIKEGLEMILDASRLPLVIMCHTGQNETSILVGCLRILQNWSFSAISSEYRSFTGTKGRYQAEQFIEVFDSDLINLPLVLPSWLNH